MPATETLLELPESAYLPQEADVMRVRRLTPLENLYTLRLRKGAPLNHTPGQFVQVSILGVGECPISVCSSPTRSDAFELTVRRVGEVTSAIHRLQEGDVVGIRGPYGRGFDMDSFGGHDLLIVTGGCALAPARSVIQYVLDRREQFNDFHVLYGARSPTELLFRDELERWRKNCDVNCMVTVDHSDEHWSGRVGVVTSLFCQLPHVDSHSTLAVVIGPPMMFTHAIMEVLALGIRTEQIYCSLERRMKCGLGKCGHCQIGSLYACIDGPVFCYAELTGIREAIE